MKPIISARNISKRYTLGARETGYSTLREALINTVRQPFKKLKTRRDKLDEDSSTLWALKDVGFDVLPGETLGIIGRNGAGKSTLLKVLSRITEPTSGEVDLYGRVGSLLEVGTGFHPELTGRENIFLNGSLLGMTRTEINKNFDEIVAFSEIEKFLDTPVKRYSSGMYMRLAFSVAAHLNPEILIVDEVLAVGDQQFQKKCLGKMNDIGKQGRTVIFVSHNMHAVASLCSHCLLLRRGELIHSGRTLETIKTYGEQDVEEQSKEDLRAIPRINSDFGKQVVISKVATVSGNTRLAWRQELHFSVSVQILDKRIDALNVGVGINDPFGTRLFTFEAPELFSIDNQDTLNFDIFITNPKLVPGTYSLAVGIRSGALTLDYLPETLLFDVDDVDANGHPRETIHTSAHSGYIEVEAKVSKTT